MAPNHSLRRLNNTGNVLEHSSGFVLYSDVRCFCFSLRFKRTDGDPKSLINSPGTDFMTARMYYCIHTAAAFDFIIPFNY